jgi:hypothetical protein
MYQNRDFGGLEMKIVNPYFLDVLLRPITGLADDDDAVLHYQGIELSNEKQYKEVIRGTLIGPFNSLDDEKKKKSEIALSYYLTKDEIDFQRVFDSCLPPFDPPTNARNFFVWLWEELFAGKDYIIPDLETYRVMPDIHEPNRPSKK